MDGLRQREGSDDREVVGGGGISARDRVLGDRWWRPRAGDHVVDAAEELVADEDVVDELAASMEDTAEGVRIVEMRRFARSEV